jgi:hypothetical protein
MSRVSKVLTVVGLFLVLSFLLVSLFLLVFAPVQKQVQISPPENAVQLSRAVPLLQKGEQSDQTYVIRDVNGKIAVFDENSDKDPVYLTNTMTDTLRESDRNQLEKGISVYGYENMLKLLEDFGS